MTLTLNPSTSIRPLGEEHLRMFRRTLDSTAAHQQTDISVALPNEANAKNNLITLFYRPDFFNLDVMSFLSRRDTLLARLNCIEFTLKDIEGFSHFIRDVPQHKRDKWDWEQVSLFVSLAINKVIRKDQTVTLDFGDVSSQFSHFGYEFRRGKIVLKGDAGNTPGHTMYGGTLVIEGDAGDYVGYFMKRGRIIVKGVVGRTPGWTSEGGEIYLEGTPEPEFASEKIGATIHYGGKRK